MHQLRQLRPEIYTESRYPSLDKSRRYRHIFDFCMDTVTIDRSYPHIGDGGTWPAYSKRPKIGWHSAGVRAFEHAYRMFRDPKFAWALTQTRGWQPSADFPFTREEIEQEALRLFEKNPHLTEKFLTEYSTQRALEAEAAAKDLYYTLLAKYADGRPPTTVSDEWMDLLQPTPVP